MAKTSRRRASSIFDSTSMKRFTGFFGGSPASEEVVQEKVQENVPQTITPPPLPPLNTNIRLQKQRSDSLQTPITALNGTPTSGTAPKATRTFSMPLPSSPKVQDPPSVHPKRVESLSLAPTPVHPPVASGSLSPYLHPSSSPVGSSRTSRNFSGASAMSGMSGISVASAASYTSYGSSRPTSSSQAQIPMPPSPTTADIPRQLKGKKGRRGIFGKKRKDDVEIPAAWRLAHGSSENLEGYNFGPLTRGGQVPDLWDPTGDTLVFLAPRNAAKSVAPSFRINSGPLMFAALGQYIEDLQFSEGPEDSQDLFLEVPRGVPSAPFKQDNRPGSAPTSSRPGGDEDLSGQPGILNQLAQTGEGDSFMDENVAYKVYYPPTDSEPKSAVPMKGKKHKHSNSDPNNDSFQRLIDVRNLFAFLNYTFLVSTLHRETPFQIMEKIFKQLQGPHSPELHAEDLNLSRKINAAEGNFLYYVEELKIDDIRNDDDAIIEALIMGERWRCQRLYREGFIHASGRWEDIKGHTGLQYISQETKKRLDRASLNLHQIRLYNVTTGLTNFDYPSVWVGDDKYPELKPWKAGFEAMRKLTLSFYKNVYGSWPPKAGKHGKGGGYTETGGLNRLVLKRLYDDFCVLYDLLVDREWIHGERIRFEATYFSEGEEGKEQRTKEEGARNALRKIMAALDNSTVPVQPNIPFDQPRLLHITAAPATEKKKSKKPRSQKKLKSDELAVVLKNSYNEDTTERARQNEFASAYLKLEADFAKGKNLDDIIEARRGRWIFMYCVLQNLPMTVVDAVGCQYGDGVEYFLCENVKGSLPWERSNNRASRMSGIWGVSGPYGGLGPAGSSSNLNGDDEIDYTYRRSHCFDIAEDWRMVQRVPGADDEFETDGESGGEGFIEYRPLDQPMPDSPKAESPGSPSGLSPAPFRQSYPNSERSQSQSPEINPEGGYVPYHQQGAVQSRENILSETYQPTYRPLTYMPAAPSESERPQSYGSHKSQGSQDASRVKALPPLDFEGPAPGSKKNSTIVMLPMSPTHKDDSPGTSIESQMDRAFTGQN